MDVFVIDGGIPLKGSVRISGSKNAVLPILAATLLTADVTELENVPDLKDVNTMCKLLIQMGANITLSRHRITVDTRSIDSSFAPYDLVRTMRASVLVMGPLLARTCNMQVSLPGGCTIGTRPIDIHIKGFRSLGVKIKLKEGYVDGVVAKSKMKAKTITLDTPSVGATENLMMYATGLEGTTVIRNAAREPEIVDLANFLKSAGAKIEGAGSRVIKITGKAVLHGVKYRVIPDRIEAGTFAIAAAITKGDICLTHVNHKHLKSVLDKLEQTGAQVQRTDTTVRVRATKSPKSVSVSTRPYPGFPTDMQSQFMALMCISTGKSSIRENLFENRYMHVPELNRMGANIVLKGLHAVIEGVSGLKGANVMASDLRAGAALVLASLAANGRSVLNRVYHIDRGYDRMERKLRMVGAHIGRRSVPARAVG